LGKKIHLDTDPKKPTKNIPYLKIPGNPAVSKVCGAGQAEQQGGSREVA
jgi:hypothetical protein